MKKSLPIMITLLGLFAWFITFSQVQIQQAWQSEYLASIHSSTENARLVEKNGFVWTGVNTETLADEGAGSASTFRILKLAADGTTLWDKLLSVNTAYQGKDLVDMKVDAGGNLYCGVYESEVVDPVKARLNTWFVVYKFDGNGNQVWKRSYHDGEVSRPFAMALDAAGNVYLTGARDESGLVQNNPGLPDYLTVKWNSSGTLQWAKTYDGASPGDGFNAAHAIAVDGSGNVYITGISQLNGLLGYATIKYNSAGTQLWVQRYNGTGSDNDEGQAIALDVSGFVYVTGSSDGSMATIKYNNDGAQIWVQREGTGGAEGKVIQVDGSGNVYVGGKSSGTAWGVVKYNFAGTRQWLATRVNGSANSLDLDDHGNVYASGTANQDALVTRYSPSGSVDWDIVNNSPLLPGYSVPVLVTSRYDILTITFTSFYRDGNNHPYYEPYAHKYTQCSLTCPSDMTLNADPGQCSRVVNYNVSSYGSCGGSLNSAPAAGSAFPVGTTTVNTTTGSGLSCSFTITVKDAEAPIAKCKNISVPLGAAGTVTIMASQVDNGSTDNCGIQSMSLSKASFDCTNIGANTVTLTVTDIHGNSSTCNAIVTIQDNTPPVAQCKAFTAYLNAAGTATITAADINDNSYDVCGPVTISIDKTSFNCTNKGANTVVLTVRDAYNNTATCNATVTVVDNLPPIITSVVANPTNLWPSDRKMKPVTITTTATDNCGALTNVITNVAIISGELANNPLGPDWQITGANTVNLRAEIPRHGVKRVYRITVTSTDASGNISTSYVDVAVSHNITSPASGAPFIVGSTINLSGEFWDKSGKTHTAKWLIDDNTTVRANLTEPAGSNNGIVTGSYKFNTAGVYKLQMNVTDQTGITSYANTADNLDAIVVIYDPNGGYTYGGGHFYSPAGALKSNLTMAGDVSYGFTVNYYRNATLPKGETQFDFKLGDFEYNALNFDYLVISGARAQFKGTGKIIGGPSGVNFIMTVIDGHLDGSGVDKVRMKIYNKNTNQVYYDNQSGASDAADPTTPVGANSTIVVVNTIAVTNTDRMTQEISESIQKLAVNKLGVLAYPNPFSDQFTLQINAPVNGLATIELFTLTGARIYVTKKPLLQGGENIFHYSGGKINSSLIYQVSIGDQRVTGILIHP